jgi:flavin reductase (DIM6/NTAB) family NADH-FMN oxidoreductase RutF
VGVTGNADFTRLTRRLDYPMFVVTVREGEERDGCLIGFATQCSIHPPRFLACLSVKNRTWRIARDARSLAVHLLRADQAALARLFGGETGDDVDKFAHCAWHDGPDGLPILDECDAWFEGIVLVRYELGDHVGFLLEPAVAHDGGNERPPLFFSQIKSLDPGHPA